MNKNAGIDDTIKALGNMNKQANASEVAVLYVQKDSDTDNLNFIVENHIKGLLSQKSLTGAQVKLLSVLLDYKK